jgi:hypothetical protein
MYVYIKKRVAKNKKEKIIVRKNDAAYEKILNKSCIKSVARTKNAR